MLVCIGEKQVKRQNDTTKIFLLRLQETGTPFTLLQITRRFSKEAHWGRISVTLYQQLRTTLLNFLCQVSTICLNWEQRDCWLLTWGPVSNVHKRGESWLWVCELWNLPWKGELKCWGMDGEEGTPCLFVFQVYYNFTLLTVVANREEGDVYVAECEYASSADVCVFSSLLITKFCLTVCDTMDA